MRAWVHHNREAFERDVLRDFCRASSLLFAQFERFAASGSISFPVLRDMVGEPLNKGLLWRLKDTAHHAFLTADLDRPAGRLLDWTLGYIFHESLKLMEDAHQQQYYVPELVELAGRDLEIEVDVMVQELLSIQDQTAESMRREVFRLEDLLQHARRLFCLYFAGARKHRPLARFLNDNIDLASRTLGGDFPRLIRAVYGDEPERMYIEAAYSLLESARSEAAARALEAALAINGGHPEVLAMRETIFVSL
ncbi:hypothetical protein LJC59_03075 [Desulfovibrio sp. OttesenSCG-928-A18]|nr:hypothetical protein [Desulfovibrio sp. OttesenSCG-928-A18]